MADLNSSNKKWASMSDSQKKDIQDALSRVRGGSSNETPQQALQRINSQGYYTPKSAFEMSTNPYTGETYDRSETLRNYLTSAAQAQRDYETSARQLAMNNYVRNLNQGRNAYNAVQNILQQNEERKNREAALQRLLSTLPQSEISSGNRANAVTEVLAKADNARNGLSYGLTKGLGYNSLVNAIGSAYENATGEVQPSLRAFNEETERAQRNAPNAFSAGNIAGNIALMGGVGSAAGAGLNALGATGRAARLAANALTFGGTEAIHGLGDVAQGNISPGRYAKNIGTSALGGVVGGEASNLVGTRMADLLLKKGMMTPFMEFVRQTASGTAFGAGNLAATQAVAYGTNDDEMKLNRRQAAEQLATTFGFSMINGAIRTLNATAAAKSALQSQVDQATAVYEQLTNGTFSEEEYIQRINTLMEFTDDLRRSINSQYLAGNQVAVNNMNDALDVIQESLRGKLSGIDAARAAGNVGNNILVDNIDPGVDATGNVIPPVNGPESPTDNQLRALAEHTVDIKEAQRQALYEAGKNQEQNIQPLMDSSTMLSEEEKFAAVRQGNLDAVNSEKDAIKAETAQPLKIESVKKNLSSDDPQTRYNAIKAGIDNGIVSTDEALSQAVSNLEESGFDPKNLIDNITKLYMDADPSLTEDAARAELVSDAGAGINPFADIDGYEREEVTMDRLIDSVQPYVNNAIDAGSETNSTNGVGRDILNEVRESISSLYPNAPKGEIDDAAEGIAEIRSTAQTTGAYRSLSSVWKPSTISEPSGSTKSGIPGRSGLVSGNQGNMAQSLDSNSGIKTVALGITDQFVKKGYVDLRGMELSSDTRTAADEVATLAMVFRNPKFETFRTIYTKGNTIVGTEAITSYLVSGSATTKEKTGIDWVNDVTDRMRRLQADGYYILHNHPSGDPTPSTVDSSTSQAYAQYVPGYKGHIVIDHNTYSFIDSKGKSSGIQVVNSKTAKNYNERVIDSPYLYRTLKTPGQVADVALNLVHDPEYSSIIFANAKGEVRAIQEVHNNFINTRDFQNYLKNRKRDFGSTQAFLATQSDSVYASSDIENAYHKNLLTDVLQLQNRNDVSSYNASGYKTGGSTFNSLGQRQDKTGAYRVNESADAYGDIQTRINQSMTMKQAENMIRSAWGLVRDWYDGEYKTAREWLENEGGEAVADQIENDTNLYERYIAQDDGLREMDYSIADVVDAYLAGTLVGREKVKPTRLDTSQPTGMKDDRFYAPKASAVTRDVYDLANSKATGKNKDAVMNARKDILFAAHNGDISGALGIKPSELNKKLRSWSNYPASAIQTSMRINRGVAPENQWTGIQNSSILSKMAVKDDDIRKAVKEVIGSGSQYERNYIARTMLAIDTHTDWSWLTVEFVKGRVQSDRASVRGDYYRGKIRVGMSAGAETVAHEMGHALDYKWEQDVFGKHASGNPLSSTNLRDDLAVSPEALQFFKNFRSFMQSLYDVSDTYSAYTQEPTEVLARFVAKFVEWTDETAGNSFYRESLSYNDKFNTNHFVEFAKLLQEKAMLDGKGLTYNGAPALVEPKSGEANYSIDLNLPDRAASGYWNEGFAAPDEDVMDISDDRQQFMQSLADSNDTVKALNVALGKSLDNKLTVSADASKVANSIVKKYRSGTDADKVSSDIAKLYESLGDAAKDSVNKIATAAADIGAEILDGIKTTDKTMQDSYPNLKKELKSYKLTISDQDKKDVGSAYDGFNNFRKKMFGKLTLVKQDTKGAVPVDTAYQELSEKYPDLFPDDIIALPEQMVRMAEVANSLKATKVNAVEGMDEYDYEMQAYVIGQEILKDYYTAAGETGYGKVFDAELAKVRQKYEKQIQRLKASNNAKVDRVKQKYEDRIAKANARREDRKARQDLLKRANEAVRLAKNRPGYASEAIKDLVNDLDLVAVGMREATKDKLREKYFEILKMRQEDPNYAALHSEKDMRKVERLFKKQIKDMDIDDVRDLITELSALIHYQETQNKLFKDSKNRTAAEAGRQWVKDLQELKPLNITSGVKQLGAKYLRNNLSPERAVRMISGYKRGSVASELVRNIEDGLTKQKEFEQKADQLFRPFLEDKANADFVKNASKQTIRIEDADGNSAMISPAMRVALYMHSKNTDNLKHIASGGVTIPDPRLYEQGKYYDAYDRGVTLKLDPTEIENIIADMTPSETDYAGMLGTFFDTYSKDAINEASMTLDGIFKAVVDNYFPITSDKNFLAKAMDLTNDPTLEGWNNLKARQEGSSNPIMLEDVTKVLQRHITKTGQYYGLAVPLRDFQKVYGYTSSGYETSVQKAIGKTWDADTKKYLEQWITDLNTGGRQAEKGILDTMRGVYAGSVLTLNPSVALKQTTSYSMAGSILDFGPLMYGLGHRFTKADQAYMDSITPWGWARRQGQSTIELGDLAKQKQSLANKIPNWNQAMDVWTTNRLFLAAEKSIQNEYPNLQRGDKEYDEALAERYNQVLWRTQPQYEAMFRPEYLRKTDIGSRTFGMFKTESMQMSGELIDALGQWRADSERAKDGTDENKRAKSESARHFYKTMASWLASNMMFAIFGSTISIALMHKGKQYRDEKGEITLDSIAKQTAKQFGSSVFGGMFALGNAYDVGQYLYDVIHKGNGNWYDIEAPGFSLINDAINNAGTMIGTLMNEESNAEARRKSIAKFAMSISKFTPVGFSENLYNMLNSVNLYIQDAMQGSLGRYEAGKGLLADTSPDKAQYANMAVSAATKGDTRTLDRALENTNKAALEKAIGAEDKYDDAGEKIDGSKKQDGIEKVMALKTSDANKAKILDILYPTKGLDAWKGLGGDAYTYYKYGVDKISEDRIGVLESEGLDVDKFVEYVSGDRTPALKDAPNQGFDSYDKLRTAYGPGARNENLHHIVEQEQSEMEGLAGFASSKVQNFNNIVSIPSGTNSVHTDISRYYTSKQDFTNGKTVREWLASKSFEEQWEFGIKKLEEYGKVVPTEKGWAFIPDADKIEDKIPTKPETIANKYDIDLDTVKEFDSKISDAKADGTLSDNEIRGVALEMMMQGVNAEDAYDLYMSKNRNDTAAVTWVESGNSFKDYLSGATAMSEAKEIKDADAKRQKVVEYLDGFDGSDAEKQALWKIAGYGESTYNQYNVPGSEEYKKAEESAKKKAEKEADEKARGITEETKAIAKEIDAKIPEDTDKYLFVSQSKEWTPEQKVEWFKSDSQRTDGKKYKAWKNAGGVDYDYIKYRGDISRYDGLPKKEKKSKVTEYINSTGLNAEKKRVLWTFAGYKESTCPW